VALNFFSQTLKVVYRTFQKRQQPLILFNVKSEIKSMLQTAPDIKMILCADTEKEIVDLFFGKTKLIYAVY
jgi:hypothetical protein